MINKPIKEGYKFFILTTKTGFVVNFTPNGRRAAQVEQQELSQDIELNNHNGIKTGQFKNDPERDLNSNKKREHESAFSATCSARIYNNDKKKKKNCTTKNWSEAKQAQQKNLQRYLDQEQAIWEINNHHKTIIDYANFVNKNNFIDSCRKNAHNMAETDYTKIITKDLSRLHCAHNIQFRGNVLSRTSKIPYTVQHHQNGEHSAKIELWNQKIGKFDCF